MPACWIPRSRASRSAYARRSVCACKFFQKGSGTMKWDQDADLPKSPDKRGFVFMYRSKKILLRVHVQAGSRFKPCARVGERGASPPWHPAATWAQSKGSKKRCVASVPLQYPLLGANPPLHYNLILQDWCFKRGSHMVTQNRTRPRPSDVTAPAQQLNRSQAVLMLTYCTRPAWVTLHMV